MASGPFLTEKLQGIIYLDPLFTYFRNTMIIVVCNIIGSLLSCSVVAYGFARLNWPGRDKVFMIVMVTMILPYQVTLVPLFLLFTKLKWVGTFLPLTITCFFGNPFFIFLLRQFFVGIPKEMTEAAKIDGAGEFRIYWQLILPMAKPALTTVAIFAFTRSWNDFLGPLVFWEMTSFIHCHWRHPCSNRSWIPTGACC